MSASTTADYPNTSSMSATANDALQNAKDTVVNSKVLHPIHSYPGHDLIANKPSVLLPY
jgi:hypothetical protein